jgi:hypothetical protein
MTKELHLMRCPYCAMKSVGETEARAWVRWLLGHYAHTHPGMPVLSPDDVEWEAVVER